MGPPPPLLGAGDALWSPSGWGWSSGVPGWESLVEVPAQGKAGVQGSPRAEAWCCRSSSSQGGSQGPGKAFPGLDPSSPLCLAPSSYWAGLGLEPTQLCPFYTVSVASSVASAGEGPFCGASGRFLNEFRDVWFMPACVLGGGTVFSCSAICPDPSEINHFPIDHCFTDNTYTNPKETEISLVIVHQIH